MNVVIQSSAESQQNMSSNTKNSNWHPADKQPCITCKKWMHIDNPIHFLGSGYECHRCYRKRTKQNLEPAKAKPDQEEKSRFCKACGLPDFTYRHEVNNWTYVLVPVKMYLTSDRKLICDRCVSDARLQTWWKNEMIKPRQQNPTYYLKHDPFAKVCTCDFCNDPNRTNRTRSTNSNFSNRKRAS